MLCACDAAAMLNFVCTEPKIRTKSFVLVARFVPRFGNCALPLKSLNENSLAIHQNSNLKISIALLIPVHQITTKKKTKPTSKISLNVEMSWPFSQFSSLSWLLNLKLLPNTWLTPYTPFTRRTVDNPLDVLIGRRTFHSIINRYYVAFRNTRVNTKHAHEKHYILYNIIIYSGCCRDGTPFSQPWQQLAFIDFEFI